MLESLNNVRCIAQPFRLCQEKEKHPPRGCQYELEMTWQPCFITTSYTSKNVVDMLLVNWK